MVAPHVGAWIEISPGGSGGSGAPGSHPTWVRGLKLERVPSTSRVLLSHPTWVRGLKFYVFILKVLTMMSHPTWVRGLKCLEVGVELRGERRTPRGCVD